MQDHLFKINSPLSQNFSIARHIFGTHYSKNVANGGGEFAKNYWSNVRQIKQF